MVLSLEDFKKEFANSKKDLDFLLNKDNRNYLKDFIGVDATIMLQIIVVKAEQLANTEQNFYRSIDGAIALPVKEMKEVAELSEKRQKDALGVLEETGLIQVDYQRDDYREEGFRTKRVVAINFDKIAKFADNFVAYLTVISNKYKYRYDFKKFLK